MASSLPSNSIFICYRRSDSEEMVDRIYDALAAEFGQGAIFRDIDTIPPGVHFPTYIQNGLRNCPLSLVFIGRDWVGCTDSHGRRRLDDSSDHVRVEIESALAVPGARVIPVMVKHALLPDAGELPESLRPLRERNGLTIRSSGPDYKADVARLIGTVEQAVTQVLAERSREAIEEVDAANANETGTPPGPMQVPAVPKAGDGPLKGDLAESKTPTLVRLAQQLGRLYAQGQAFLPTKRLKPPRPDVGERKRPIHPARPRSPAKEQPRRRTKSEPLPIWAITLVAIGILLCVVSLIALIAKEF